MHRVALKATQLPPEARKNSKSKRVSKPVMPTMSQRWKEKWLQATNETYHPALTTRYLEKSFDMNYFLRQETTARAVTMSTLVIRKWSKCIKQKLKGDGTRELKLRSDMYFRGFPWRNKIRMLKIPLKISLNRLIRTQVFSLIEEYSLKHQFWWHNSIQK